MGRIHGENTDLSGDTKVCVPGTRHKCHRSRHEKILDGYEKFSTYIIVGSFRASINFGRSYVRCHVMTSGYSRVGSRI